MNNASLPKTIALTLAGCYVLAVYSGVRNNFGLMLEPVVVSTGISFSFVSLVLAVGQFVFGLVQPAFGVASAKWGNLLAILAGVALTGGGLLLLPLCRTGAALMACLGVMLPAGTGAIAYGLIVETIARQIPPRLSSVSSGAVNASNGLGNMAFSPLVGLLLRRGGIGHAAPMLAIPVALTLPVALFLSRGRGAVAQDAGRGAAPAYGRDAARPGAQGGQPPGLAGVVRDAFHSRLYLLLAAGFFTCGFHMAVILNHLPTEIESFGFPAGTAANAFSVFGATTIIGSLLSGSLCARTKMKNVLGALYALRPLTILLFLAVPKTVLSVTVFTGLYGFSGASTVPPVSGLIGKRFGPSSIATLYGIVFVVHQVGGFFGSWLGGVCFERTGGYAPVWLACAALGAAAAAASFAIREPKL
ncbi:MAG: MFS transporter [Clostridiales Family XIII bacterium]|nr:MFS transporter [Clostridiales Family XIII bacterium]